MRGRVGPRMKWRPRFWGIGAAVLGAAVLAGTGFTGAAQAAYRGSEGRIAFVRNGDIYSIRTDGSGLARLTTDGHDSGPRWSPDGTRIAYLDHGNLWIMKSNGHGKTQITNSAPGATDARPSWSPGGRFLAFVKTARHATRGYLTRYNTVTHALRTFTASSVGVINVTALPGTAVAWDEASDASGQPAYFILFEATGTGLCQANYYCLDALGLAQESQFTKGYPSAEDQTPMPARLTDPDWFPVDPAFATDVLSTAESCSPAAQCTHTGINLQIGSPTILPGAYQAVYSPTGRHIAFVRNARGTPEIYLGLNSPLAGTSPTLLTAGTQPDWQPVAPFPAG